MPLIMIHFFRSLNLSYSNEISQTNNFNATTKLWIQENNLVFKEYVLYNKTTIKNIMTLLVLSLKLRHKDFPEINLPISIIIKYFYVKGYLMPFCVGTSISEFLKSNTNTDETKLFALIELVKVIEKLPSHIFIGDLHGRNVIVEPKGNIHIIDIDGFSVYFNKISCPISSMYPYDFLDCKKYRCKNKKIKISKDSDIFCFFVLFLQWLMDVENPFQYTQEEINKYLNYLNRVKFPKDIICMVRKLFTNESNYLNADAFYQIDLNEIKRYRYKTFALENI